MMCVRDWTTKYVDDTRMLPYNSIPELLRLDWWNFVFEIFLMGGFYGYLIFFFFIKTAELKVWVYSTNEINIYWLPPNQRVHDILTLLSLLH